MGTSPNQPLSEQDGFPQAEQGKKTNPELLARLVIREGKTFYHSALEAGYAETVARNGLKQAMAGSTLVSQAVRAETERMATRLETLKPMAVQRLYHEIADYESPYGMKAIELAGRFKETDWFVRNQDMQLGVFVNLTESSPETKDLDTFKE